MPDAAIRHDEASCEPPERRSRLFCLKHVATLYRLRLPFPDLAAIDGHAAAWSTVKGFCMGEGWALGLPPDPMSENVRAAVVEILGVTVPRRLNHGPSPRLSCRAVVELRKVLRAEDPPMASLELLTSDLETWDVFGLSSDPHVDPEARDAARILTATADPGALGILLDDEFTRTAIVAELVFRGYKLTRDETAGRPPWWGALLAELRRTGNVSAAAQAAGVVRATVYNWRDKSPEFKAELEAALQEHARTNGEDGGEE